MKQSPLRSQPWSYYTHTTQGRYSHLRTICAEHATQTGVTLCATCGARFIQRQLDTPRNSQHSQQRPLQSHLQRQSAATACQSHDQAYICVTQIPAPPSSPPLDDGQATSLLLVANVLVCYVGNTWRQHPSGACVGRSLLQTQSRSFNPRDPSSCLC